MIIVKINYQFSNLCLINALGYSQVERASTNSV